MSKRQRFLGVLLTSVLLLSVPACGSQEPTNAGTADAADGLAPLAMADDPVTFRVFIRDPGTAPAKDNPVLKRITELTGVTIEFEFLVGDLDQRQGVMIASEDYPDAIFAESARFIDAGAFIPLGDRLGDHPNLNAHYAPFSAKMTAGDGHRYVLELYDARRNPAPTFTNGGAGFFIQKAVLADAGYVIPRTVDEYFQLIGDYKARNPTIDGGKTIGYEILCDGWRDFCLRNPPQHLMGAGNDGDVFVDPDTLQASFYQISDTAKAWYGRLNRAFAEGIIEAETFTQSYEQYMAHIASGAVLGFFDQGWNFAAAESVLRTEGKFERTYVSVPIANPGVRDSYLDAQVGSFTGNNGLGITKSCKDPDRLLAFYDWLIQPEVQVYLQWGVEGVDFTVTESGGRMLTQARREINGDDAKKRDLTGNTLWSYSPKAQGLYDDGSPCGPGDSEDEYKASLSAYDQKFLNAYGFNYPAQMLSAPATRPAYYPVWAMSVKEGSAAMVANASIVETCRKYYPRLILSKPAAFEALWNEYVGAFSAIGPQPYLDEVNRQITAIMGTREPGR